MGRGVPVVLASGTAQALTPTAKATAPSRESGVLDRRATTCPSLSLFSNDDKPTPRFDGAGFAWLPVGLSDQLRPTDRCLPERWLGCHSRTATLRNASRRVVVRRP